MDSELIKFLMDISGFLIKAVIVVVSLLIILAFALKSQMSQEDEKVTIKDLNKKFKSLRLSLLKKSLDKKELKKLLKQEDKQNKKAKTEKAKTYVLQFKGDIKASAVEELRECITAVLSVATKEDEVVCVLESPGGMVHTYGLAASQLQRLKDADIPLTICVDKVAASGGYMMACLADHIVAAPFAIIGSVGVLAQVPNFNKILKKNDIDYYQVTAGKFKRTLTLMGEVTEDGLSKFKEDIEDTHDLFKKHITHFRPIVDVESIATGEHWYGQQALDLKLVDQLGTSDDHLMKRHPERKILAVSIKPKKSFKDKLAGGLAKSIEATLDMLHTKSIEKPF